MSFQVRKDGRTTSCSLFEYDSSLLYSSTTANIASILKEAEEIIDNGGPQVWGPSFGLEPTPLGPQGVETVVKDMPLTDSSWHKDATFKSLFVPLVLPITKRSFTYSIASSTLRAEKVLKKHRMSCNPTEPEVQSSNGIPSQHEECYDSDDMDPKERFRSYQAQQWNERFADLEEFRNKNGHCLVPHNFAENPSLAQWVKRQRYQYKLKEERKHSTLTEERQAKLDAMAFIWDSHKAVWEEKYKALHSFRANHGHANVPSKHNDKALAIWVKCQRRQHKLFLKGFQSAMSMERVYKLESVDFVWNPRNL
jgi:hypothetical protein